MNRSLLKLKILHWLMVWLAGHVWEMAQDAVYLLAERPDLDDPAKLALARTLLLDRVREAGESLSTSVANFLLEAAVQVMKNSDRGATSS